MRICTLGDLLLDVIVRLEEPLSRGADAVARTRSGAGGQAANVSAWVAELGADARFVGKRGNDTAGALVAQELEERGVELCGPVVEGPTAKVVAEQGHNLVAGRQKRVRGQVHDPGHAAESVVGHIGDPKNFHDSDRERRPVPMRLARRPRRCVTWRVRPGYRSISVAGRCRR